jgi:hypothetical protein
MSNVDTINDAAENYADHSSIKYVLKQWFIDGVKSDAAKQYWYAQFKAEQKPIGNVWVDVKDRLPDVGVLGCVSVLCLVNKANHYILDFIEDDGRKNFYLNQRNVFENWTEYVTHWQYLQPLDETPAPQLTDEEIEKLTDKEQIEILKQKLRVAEEALNDIVRFDDELEDEWGDPGERANAALEKMMIIDGF